MGFVTSSTEEDFAFIPYNNRKGQSLAVEEGSDDDGNEGLLRRRCHAAPPSLHEWNAAALTGSVLDRLLPFLEFVNGFVAENDLEHYWLTIRATTPTAEYDRPRWHTDDMFFDRSDSNEPSTCSPPAPPAPTPRRWSFWGQPTAKKPKAAAAGDDDEEELCPNKGHQLDLETDWKVCTTLLGPSTMFIPAPHQPAARERQRTAKEASRRAHEHACTSIRCVGCASTAEDVRRDLGAALADLGRVQAGPGQCSFFRIGPERGAVHSEPRMSEDVGEGGLARGRIFVNVVPGRREELGRLMGKWGMEFPRSWWIAPSRVSPRTSS
ncbi:hypothetical protein PG993_011709 [Apiospora rasikravindrae]|uniref:Uncharacterized protein n=1 Tax=Apiospora rasikravindrae TaxID=990691 RepID=A0ABR1S0H7_9PEZI